MSIGRKRGLFFLSLGLLFLLFFTQPVNASWEIEPISLQGLSPNMYICAMAVDSKGKPHIFITEGGTGAAYYSKLTDQGWSAPEMLVPSSSPCTGWNAEIVFDKQDQPRILFYNDCAGQPIYGINYAEKVNETWVIKNLDNGFWTGKNSGLQLDSNGDPHVVYTSIDGNLKYAKRIGGSWSSTNIENIGFKDGSNRVGLALDLNNNLHVVYVHITNGFLRYAKWNGAAWEFQNIEQLSNSAPWYYADPSITLDESNYPHISYINDSNLEGNRKLKYAKWNGTNWDIQTVVQGGRTVSIDMDETGGVHLAYGNATNKEIKYSVLSSSSTEWETEIVNATITSNINDIKFDLDKSNTPHVVFDLTSASGTHLGLQYAKKENPATVNCIPSSATPQQGEQVCVQVDLANLHNIYAAGFDLTYNPAVLDYQEITEGNFLNQDGEATSLQVSPLNGNEGSGQMVVGISRMGEVAGVSGSGNLATLCFEVIGGYCSTSDITFGNAVLEGSAQDTEITATWNGSTLTVTLGVPANPHTSDPGTHNRIDLCWDGVPGATSYEIYSSDTAGTLGEHVGTTSNTCYQDTDCILPTLNYYYTVRALTNNGACLSEFSVQVSGRAAGLLGDINDDGRVNGRDLSRLARAFGASCNTPRYDCRADLNRDCLVDGDDLSLLATDFGKTL